MTPANLPIPIFTRADLSARVNAAMPEGRAARRFPSLAALIPDTSLAYGIRSAQVELFGQARVLAATGSKPAIPVLVGT